MQTKAGNSLPHSCLQGNCPISNFGKVPEGRELWCHYLSIRSVTCLQHVVALLFFPPSPLIVLLNSCQDKSGERLAGCQAPHPQSHSLCTQECVYVRLGTCCSREAPPKVRLRGRIWKTALCAGKPASPPNAEEKTKQNGRCASLRGNPFCNSESNLERP